MDRICGVIDVDGFSLNKDTFYTRELGYVALTRNEKDVVSYSFRFNLSPFVSRLQPADWTTILYCKRFVHGLSFRPLPHEKHILPYTRLREKIVQCYNESKTEERPIVAYKGGNFEKRLLANENIPSLDLEKYGCPLFDNLPLSTTASMVRDCGYHRPVTCRKTQSPKRAHCPLVECVAFANWIRHNVLCDDNPENFPEKEIVKY